VEVVTMQIRQLGSKPPVLSIRIDSPLEEEERREIGEAIERAAAAGPVRVLVAVPSYPSLNSAEDLLDDLRFLKLYADRIARAAVVSDRAWQRTFAGLFSLFSGVKMEWFDASETKAAAAWLESA
jgi:hypothetical protein